MIKDYFKLALENISHRKVRSWLTIIGIVIGIAAVVALVSLAQGVQQVITQEFEQLGVDKIIITPGGAIGGVSYQGTKPLTAHDVDVVDRVKGVKLVASYYLTFESIHFKNDVSYGNAVTGMPLDNTRKIIEDTNSYKLTSGRDLIEGDKYKCLIGYDFASGNVFTKNVIPGDRLMIANHTFEVVGTLDRIGNPTDDSSVIVPIKTLQEIYGTDEVSGMIAQTVAGEDPAAVADNIKRTMRRDRNLKEGNEDFSIQTTAEYLQSFNTILAVVTGIVVGIALISLIVGGVGIMNTMYTATLERTNEIGIMKAVGAKNSDIMQIFLIESGVIGLLGGILGIIIGIVLSKIVEFIGKNFLGTTLLSAYFQWYLILGALAFAFLVGMSSGVMPAIQASKMKPVDALRYE
jgi:putative ABC transport system permease protein